jgi:hypothetical protein
VKLLYKPLSQVVSVLGGILAEHPSSRASPSCAGRIRSHRDFRHQPPLW